MSMKEQNEMVLTGGWSEYSCVNREQKEIFEEATKGLEEAMEGKSYSPVACACQAVSGMNYEFFCNVTKPQTHMRAQAILEIYKPLNAKAQVHSVREL